MLAPGILLVGEDLAELQEVVGALTDGAISHSGSTQLWTIENKYYIAQVAISTLSTAQIPFELQPHIDHQAVVAVFSVGPTDSLARLQQLWSRIEELGQSYEVQLAVALCTESADPPAWLEHADSWFAEQLTELIVVKHIPIGGAGSGGGGPRIAAADGGAEGMDRVAEALQAHMWPGMQLKPAERRGGDSAVQHSTLPTDAQVPISTDSTPLGDAHMNGLNVEQEEEDAEDDDALERMFAEVLGKCWETNTLLKGEFNR